MNEHIGVQTTCYGIWNWHFGEGRIGPLVGFHRCHVRHGKQKWKQPDPNHKNQCDSVCWQYEPQNKVGEGNGLEYWMGLDICDIEHPHMLHALRFVCLDIWRELDSYISGLNAPSYKNKGGGGFTSVRLAEQWIDHLMSTARFCKAGNGPHRYSFLAAGRELFE